MLSPAEKSSFPFRARSWRIRSSKNQNTIQKMALGGRSSSTDPPVTASHSDSFQRLILSYLLLLAFAGESRLRASTPESAAVPRSERSCSGGGCTCSRISTYWPKWRSGEKKNSLQYKHNHPSATACRGPFHNFRKDLKFSPSVKGKKRTCYLENNESSEHLTKWKHRSNVLEWNVFFLWFGLFVYKSNLSL